jgi:hypothetical protein
MTNEVDLSLKESAKKVLELIEKTIKLRQLDRQHHRDEVEKHWSIILQGQDLMDIYQIRRAGITDEEWESAKKDFFAIKKKREGAK